MDAYFYLFIFGLALFLKWSRTSWLFYFHLSLQSFSMGKTLKLLSWILESLSRTTKRGVKRIQKVSHKNNENCLVHTTGWEHYGSLCMRTHRVLSVCHVRMFPSGLLKPASKSIAKHRNRSLSDNKWLYLDWKISVYFTAHMPLLSLPLSPGPRVAHTDADVHATRHTRESEGERRRWYFKLNRFYTPPYGPHPKSGGGHFAGWEGCV